MNLGNLASAASFFTGMIAEIDKQRMHGLEAGCMVMETEIKGVLGTDGYNWPALSPETHKTQPGMLLETGELRDSIQHTVVSPSEAHVGSDNDKAIWHEMGTPTIPPRSFLVGAAVAKKDEIGKAVGAKIIATLRQ